MVKLVLHKIITNGDYLSAVPRRMLKIFFTCCITEREKLNAVCYVIAISV